MVNLHTWSKSFARRRLTRRYIDVPEVILTWYGSFGRAGGATLGDFLAVNNLSTELASAGVSHSIITAGHDWQGEEWRTHQIVDDLFAIKTPGRCVAFVCGPLTDWTEMADFFAMHPKTRKVAVGVSVLPNHQRIVSYFDKVVARDGRPDATFDLAISSVHAPAVKDVRTVGLCLRGAQSEYAQPAMADKAETLLRSLAASEGLHIQMIDTVIRPENSATDIAAAFQSVDCVFTTRMHGALLALVAGKPVIAIDQVPGMAKVTAVLDSVQWPLVYPVEKVTETDLRLGLARIKRSDVLALVSRSQSAMIARGRNALAASVAAICES